MATTQVGKVELLASINTSDYEKGVKEIEKANDGLERSSDRTAKRSNAAFSSIAKVGLAAIAAASIAVAAAITKNIGNAVKRVDTLNNAPIVLQNLGFSAEESADSIANVASNLRGLPTRLDDMVSSLTAIASSSGFGLEKATELTVAFNNMALAGGKGAQDAQRAFVQFTQALGRGAFQANDFNTLMEVMPAQLSQVAKSLIGPKANAQTLRDALSEGEVSVEQFSDAIINLNKKGGKGFASFDRQARDATKGISTGWDNLNAAIIRGVSGIIDVIGSDNITESFSRIGESLEGALNKVAGLIEFVADNKNVFAPIAVGISAVVAATTTWIAVTKLATLAQAAFNAVLAANPIGLVALAIIGLVAGLTYFFTQTETGRRIFASFMSFMTGVFNSIKSGISSATSFTINSFNRIKTALGNVWNWIRGVFSTIGSIAANVIKLPVNAILGFADRTINGFIRTLNSVIGTINKLPGVNIGTLSTLSIPRLAQGGIVPATPGGILANIGEGRETEVVMPLSKLDEVLSKERSEDASKSNQSTVIQFSPSPSLMREAAIYTIELVNEANRAKGLPEIGIR